ncbi:hypothetical protein PCANC_14362 [Puccinia coronata f. sp. avenae]|uniref:Uncharacterized protein n=1 Tax=Puccinia coronata f. sp. avenae TaxID=200324 RepID=A0A2N5V9I6_9BASI|nr:hypothetical protein PCANC_14362 [Puccinia coronata f. sp. avenae]
MVLTKIENEPPSTTTPPSHSPLSLDTMAIFGEKNIDSEIPSINDHFLVWSPSLDKDPLQSNTLSETDIMELPPLLSLAFAARYFTVHFIGYLLQILKDHQLPAPASLVSEYRRRKEALEKPWENQKEKFINARKSYLLSRVNNSAPATSLRALLVPFLDIEHVRKKASKLRDRAMVKAQLAFDDRITVGPSSPPALDQLGLPTPSSGGEMTTHLSPPQHESTIVPDSEATAPLTKHSTPTTAQESTAAPESTAAEESQTTVANESTAVKELAAALETTGLNPEHDKVGAKEGVAVPDIQVQDKPPPSTTPASLVPPHSASSSHQLNNHVPEPVELARPSISTLTSAVSKPVAQQPSHVKTSPTILTSDVQFHNPNSSSDTQASPTTIASTIPVGQPEIPVVDLLAVAAALQADQNLRNSSSVHDPFAHSFHSPSSVNVRPHQLPSSSPIQSSHLLLQQQQQQQQHPRGNYELQQSLVQHCHSPSSPAVRPHQLPNSSLIQSSNLLLQQQQQDLRGNYEPQQQFLQQSQQRQPIAINTNFESQPVFCRLIQIPPNGTAVGTVATRPVHYELVGASAAASGVPTELPSLVPATELQLHAQQLSELAYLERRYLGYVHMLDESFSNAVRVESSASKRLSLQQMHATQVAQARDQYAQVMMQTVARHQAQMQHVRSHLRVIHRQLPLTVSHSAATIASFPPAVVAPHPPPHLVQSNMLPPPPETPIHNPSPPVPVSSRRDEHSYATHETSRERKRTFSCAESFPAHFSPGMTPGREAALPASQKRARGPEHMSKLMEVGRTLDINWNFADARAPTDHPPSPPRIALLPTPRAPCEPLQNALAIDADIEVVTAPLGREGNTINGASEAESGGDAAALATDPSPTRAGSVPGTTGAEVAVTDGPPRDDPVEPDRPAEEMGDLEAEKDGAGAQQLGSVGTEAQPASAAPLSPAHHAGHDGTGLPLLGGESAATSVCPEPGPTATATIALRSSSPPRWPPAPSSVLPRITSPYHPPSPIARVPANRPFGSHPFFPPPPTDSFFRLFVPPPTSLPLSASSLPLHLPVPTSNLHPPILETTTTNATAAEQPPASAALHSRQWFVLDL